MYWMFMRDSKKVESYSGRVMVVCDWILKNPLYGCIVNSQKKVF